MSEVISQPSQEIVKEDEVCVCFNLRRASRIITQIYDDVMRPLGYRATQITLLGVISKNAPITIKELAEVMDTDRTTLTRNLRLLEHEGLLKITEGKVDRRQRQVEMTEKGQEVLLRAYPAWKETQTRIAQLVGREHLNQLLKDLSGALEKIQR